MPRVSARHVHRPRLTAVLNDAGANDVVLVSAPAGYGKSLLLAEWVGRDLDRTAWVTLDHDDCDDRTLWSMILDSLADLDAVPARSALRTLDLPSTPSRDTGFLAALTAAVDLLPIPVRLVLDDVHELTGTDPLHGLAQLIRHRSPRMRLVVACRRDPPLPFAKLRLTGELCEIRAPSLAFDLDEADELLTATAVTLGAGHLRLLVEQTEGWAAGLRLAAASLRETSEPEEFLSDLAVNDRTISDYLAEEVIARLSTRVVEILQAVSICTEVSAPLAVAVTADESAAEVLASAQRENALVASHGAGRRWFRLHPLMRAHLVADLRRRRPEQVATLHRRAARWFDGADAPAAALHHAALAADHALLIDLLHRHAVPLAIAGEHRGLEEALDAIGPGPVRADPRLGLAAALVDLEFGRVSRVDRHLADVARAWPADADAGTVTLHGLVRAQRGGLGAPGATGTEPAEENANRAEPDLTGPDLPAVLQRLSSALVEDRLDDAEQLARHVVERAGADANPYLEARGTMLLAATAAPRGDLRRMTTLIRHARAVAPSPDPLTVGAGLATLLPAYAALLQSRPDDCLRLLAPMADHTDPLPTIGPVLDILLGAARFDSGHLSDGLDTIRRARARLPRKHAFHRSTSAFTALVEHDAAIRLGFPAHAAEVVDWAQERLGETGEVQLMRATAATRISRHDSARRHLQPLLDGTARTDQAWSVINAHLLDCWIALQSDHLSHARRALDNALVAAHRTTVWRPLVHAPAEISAFTISRLPGLGPLAAPARTALDLRSAAPPAPPTLTDRERTVLAHLPSQRSLTNIAADLDVTTNTVKTHVQAIYRKLDVSSRRDAIVAAHDRGLL